MCIFAVSTWYSRDHFADSRKEPRERQKKR
jgi:hypothetical protein